MARTDAIVHRAALPGSRVGLSPVLYPGGIVCLGIGDARCLAVLAGLGESADFDARAALVPVGAQLRRRLGGRL